MPCRNGLGDLLGARQQLIGLDHLIHQAHPQCLGSGDGLSGKNHFERRAFADQPWEALGSPIAGDNTDLDLGLPQTRVGAGDPQRAGQRQFTAPAQGEAVDAGDHRLAAVLDQAKDSLPAGSDLFPFECRERSQLRDVCAGNKGLLSRSRNQNGADLGVLPDVEENLFQLGHAQVIERIEHLGAVKGDDRNRGPQFVAYVFHFHGLPIPGRNLDSKRQKEMGGKAFVPRCPGGTLREMIKGITIVRPAGSPEAYTKLASFFSALGFEGGRGWEEKLSRGVSFLAPLGNLEFADGIAPSAAEIMVEVTGLDSVQAVAHDWMVRTWGEHEAARRLTAVTETGWKTRLFTENQRPATPSLFGNGTIPTRVNRWPWRAI